MEYMCRDIHVSKMRAEQLQFPLLTGPGPFAVTKVSSEKWDVEIIPRRDPGQCGIIISCGKTNGIISRPGSKLYYYKAEAILEKISRCADRVRWPQCWKVDARILWGEGGSCHNAWQETVTDTLKRQF